MLNPAQRLLPGTELNNGWTIEESIQSQEGDTGGCFSERYKVSNGERTAFLKAMDYHQAFAPGVDTPRALKHLVDEYIFERDLHEMCKEVKMSHVAHILDYGSINIGSGHSHDNQIEYLIFELAKGDVRRTIEVGNPKHIGAVMNALHNIALGLWQLHKKETAHQDIKPSNALVFDGGTTKVADLGRASRRGHAIQHDECLFPGDPAYVPPEFCYGYIDPNWSARRLGADLFMLGSMIAYFFSGSSMIAHIKKELSPEHVPGKVQYEEAIPYLQRAFHISVAKLREAMPDSLEEDIVILLKQLCEPDLKRRGHPRSILNRHENQYSLERYVGHFATLARKAALIKAKPK